MSFQDKTTDELVRIAAAGGGVRLPATGRPTADLVRIASAARNSGAVITLVGVGDRTADDLVRISSAGKGVVLEG